MSTPLAFVLERHLDFEHWVKECFPWIQFEIFGRPAPRRSTIAVVPKSWTVEAVVPVIEKALSDGMAAALEIVKSPKVVVTTGADKRTAAWQRAIAVQIRYHRPSLGPWTGPLGVWTRFYIPKPQAAIKEKREFPSVTPDLGNLQQSLDNALQKVIIENDSRIVMRGLDMKLYCEPDEDPVTKVLVWKLDCEEEE